MKKLYKYELVFISDNSNTNMGFALANVCNFLKKLNSEKGQINLTNMNMTDTTHGVINLNICTDDNNLLNIVKQIKKYLQDIKNNYNMLDIQILIK